MDANTRKIATWLINLITAFIMLQSVSHIAHRAESLSTEPIVISGEGVYGLLSFFNALLQSGWLFAIAVDMGIVVLFLVLPFYPTNNYLIASLIGMISISTYSNIDSAIEGELQYGAIAWGWYGAWRVLKVFLFSVPLSVLPIALVEIRKKIVESEPVPAPQTSKVTTSSNARTYSTDRQHSPAQEDGGVKPDFIPQRPRGNPLPASDVGKGQVNDQPLRRGGLSFPLTSTLPDNPPKPFGLDLPVLTEPPAPPPSLDERTDEVQEIDEEEKPPVPVGTLSNSRVLDGMNLTDKERRAVELRLDKRGYTLDDIGRVMGNISKQAVSGLLSSAKTKNPTLIDLMRGAVNVGTSKD